MTISNGQTTTATGTYTQQTGSLQVTISPQGAIDAGAKWRRVGTGTWQNSGCRRQGFRWVQYTVEFSDVSGWTKPANQPVTISNGQTTTSRWELRHHSTAFPSHSSMTSAPTKDGQAMNQADGNEGLLMPGVSRLGIPIRKQITPRRKTITSLGTTSAGGIPMTSRGEGDHLTCHRLHWTGLLSS